MRSITKKDLPVIGKSFFVVNPARFELATFGSASQRSIQLSYGSSSVRISLDQHAKARLSHSMAPPFAPTNSVKTSDTLGLYSQTRDKSLEFL
jgi:hypothetical protein